MLRLHDTVYIEASCAPSQGRDEGQGMTLKSGHGYCVARPTLLCLARKVVLQLVKSMLVHPADSNEPSHRQLTAVE